MLTQAQIQCIARRNGVGMQVQERDYVQHLMLGLLYARTQDLALKGGMALRLVYGGQRYAEELDFDGPEDAAALKALWREIVAGLENVGVVAEMRRPSGSDVGYTFDVGFRGPLYDGRNRSEGVARVDVNRRPEVVESCRELVHPEYDDVRPFAVMVLTLECLLADKMRAMLVRGRPRDLYDIWLLCHRGVRPDPALIERELACYGMRWEPGVLGDALECVRDDWERDLRALLPRFVSCEDALEGIAALLE
jgi:predicted nucleotidyltransferase component of viral defense system